MTLYLSRLTLKRTAPTAALMPLLDPPEPGQAADAHHRLMWSVFSDGAARERDFLWRHDGRGRFLALSARTPAPNDLFRPHETKVFEPRLSVGDRLHFKLRANATKDRAAASRGPKRQRKDRRVDIVMDRLHREAPAGDGRSELRDRIAEDAARDWMTRQGVDRGFRPRLTAVENYSTINLGRRRREGATLGILDLAGSIEVTVPDVFVAALARGFGRAKAWGCGLMLIRRAP